MEILITGGTTFVSKFAAEYFVKQNDHITVLNRGSRPQIPGTDLIQCDRTQLGSTLKDRSFDLILDITAYTEEHIKTLLESGVRYKDYIFISSSAVYPETNPQPFTENQQTGCNSIWGDYGINKLKAEQYLLQQNPDAYILRPPYFYGIYENLYREAFAFDCAIQDRIFYLPPNSEMKLQFFHVADLCRFIEILMEKHPVNHIFNVGNPQPVTIRDWITLCYEAAGKTVQLATMHDTSIPLWNYFCFRDYEYMLDVSRQTELMPNTTPLAAGLHEEYEWYAKHPESIYNRKPYMNFLDGLYNK